MIPGIIIDTGIDLTHPDLLGERPSEFMFLTDLSLGDCRIMIARFNELPQIVS
jgi:hypothetical protein